MESTHNKTTLRAAIDLGSNSFRLLIGRVNNGKITVQVNRLETVRLGKGLADSGKISSKVMARGFEVLASFKEDLVLHDVDICRCCGTQALRKAINSDVFLERAATLLGLEIDVINGHEEAILSCRGVLAGIDKNIFPPLLLIDVGGGSTEFAYQEKASTHPRTTSIPLGALLGEKPKTGQASSHWNEMVTALRDFQESTGIPLATTKVVGSGGTATALAGLALGLERYDAEKVQGYYLDVARLNEIARNISAMSMEERNLLPGLEQGRGDIILAGIEIYQEILATIEVEGMIVSDYGLLEGILLSSLEQ